MKKVLFILLVITVLAVPLMGSSKWNTRLMVYNDSGDDVYIDGGASFFDKSGVAVLTMKNGLTNTWWGETNAWQFDFPRGVYSVKITACGVTKRATLDLTSNVQVRIPACEKMNQTTRPLWLGEPTLEKVNMLVRAPFHWRLDY